MFILGGEGTNIHVWFCTSALKSSLITLALLESLDSWVKHVGSKGGLEMETLREGTTRGFSDPVIEQVTITWAWLCDWLKVKLKKKLN